MKSYYPVPIWTFFKSSANLVHSKIIQITYHPTKFLRFNLLETLLKNTLKTLIPCSTVLNQSPADPANPVEAITNNRTAIIRVCSSPFRRKLKTNCRMVPWPGRFWILDYLLAIARFLSRAITVWLRVGHWSSLAENRKANSVSPGHVTTPHAAKCLKRAEYYNATRSQTCHRCSVSPDIFNNVHARVQRDS